jgi:outer membrane protein assembly factor BamA
MKTRHFGCVALALVAMARPAAGQDAAPTRASDALAAREAKAIQSAPFKPGRVERLLTLVETSPAVRGTFAPADGFGVRVGGIENGSGLAVGPSWRRQEWLNGTLATHASAAAAIMGDREVDAGIALPRLGSHRLSAHVQATGTQLAGERFFGLGRKTQRTDETAFRVDRRQLETGVVVNATDWLRVSAGASLLQTSAADGRARGVAGIATRFSDREAPGLMGDASFRLWSLGATVDYRDLPGNPRIGGRYHLGVDRYVDATTGNYSFTRIDAEVEQHLSAWKRQRVLTLRALTSASLAGEGHDVPFYLQRTLGGSRLLRGFVTDRFRDRNLLVLQAEYGFDLLPFVSAVAFYEAGTVAPRWQELSLGDVRRDYGLGFRFGGARAVALRTDVALGSGEGTRLTMRFSHAF